MFPSLNKVIAGFVLSLAAIGVAHSAPVTPLDFSTGWNTGLYVTNPSSVDGNVDWFVFDSDGATATSFYFDRTEPAPDLIAGLYRGDTTGFDYVAAGAGTYYSFSQAHIYNSALTFINVWDDNHDDRFGGPFGDPDFSILLSAGRYSLSLSSLNSAGGYQFLTNETSALNAVPEPATIALFGLGLLSFAASRRRSVKNKNI